MLTLCTLGGVNQTLLDPNLFQINLNFANLTCQQISVTFLPLWTLIRKIEFALELILTNV